MVRRWWDVVPSARDPRELPPGPAGQRFGRYVLLDRIGAGGMAEVFRAVAHGVEGFHRLFVIKRIRPERCAAPDFVDMFINEARISALLSHPSIVQIYEFGEVNGVYFLAMEYLRGQDLASLLGALKTARGQVAPDVAAHIAEQVARGLAYAHDLIGPGGKPLGLVHRDVSPANIMLLRSGGVKLLDFGIAKAAVPRTTASTDFGVVKGKVGYLSPEQARGEKLDGRTDVFALGVVLWETLTGHRLFVGKSDADTVTNVLRMPIPPPSTLRHDCPTALDYVAVRALERRRDRRYASAQAMADDLESIVRDLRHQHHALPNLLDQVFGPDNEASELGEAAATVPTESAQAPVAPPLPRRDRKPASHRSMGRPHFPAQRPAPPARRSSPRRRARIGAVAVAAACVMGAAWALWPLLDTPAPRPEQIASRPAPAPVRPDTPAPLPLRIDDVVLTADVVSATSGAFRPAVRSSRQRAPEARVHPDRIRRGLSIDPFVEARSPRVGKR